MTTRRPTRRVEPMRRLVVLAAAADARCGRSVRRRRDTRVSLRRRGGRDHRDLGDPVDARSGFGRRDGPRLAAPLARRRSAQDREGDALARSHGLDRGSGAPSRLALLLRLRPGPCAKPAWHLRHGAGIDHERERSLRGLRRRRRDPGQGRKARLQRLPGVRSDGERGECLQHQSRRHHLLGQRGRRRAGRADREREVGQVPARAQRFQRWSGSVARPVSTATGTTTSSSTTSRARSTAARSTRRASRRSPTTRRSRSRPRTGSTERSAGERTSISSSSMSARSAAPRQPRRAAVISLPPRRKPCATRSPPSRPV